ncbi:MAG: geranylgeranylglycerol-phosphate geranylgeranyltransferase [Candidatus Cloacimonetes bacterium]|nr:geranylgeranylglycerol-phosphate geranylgeranyltransferase [Candidatus Cloacimonadota bacterium]
MNYFLLTRPINCFFVAITVVFGALYRANIISINNLIFAILSAVFISAAGYVINDFFDIPIDSINKPKRILPSKKIKPSTAYIYAVFLFILGILFSFLTKNSFNVLIALTNSILLFYYAKRIKMKLFWSNLIVAYTAATTFIFGGLVNNNLFNSMIIALFAFLFTFSREIVKDLEDVKGDNLFGAKTFPLVFGINNSIRLTLIPIFLIFFYSFFLWNKDIIKFYSFILLAIFVIVPLYVCFLVMKKKTKTKTFAKISTLMKFDMFILLIILGLDF